MKSYLQTKFHFSACHRLHSKVLSDKENKELYGACNNLNGHGHNYMVYVILFGKVDETTGMLINLSELKKIIADQVVPVVDHKNLDFDVPYFRDSNIVSTTENLTKFIWDILVARLPAGTLYEVRIDETEKNTFFYRGD